MGPGNINPYVVSYIKAHLLSFSFRSPDLTKVEKCMNGQ